MLKEDQRLHQENWKKMKHVVFAVIHSEKTRIYRTVSLDVEDLLTQSVWCGASNTINKKENLCSAHCAELAGVKVQ